jgi:hypothetical protein
MPTILPRLRGESPPNTAHDLVDVGARCPERLRDGFTVLTERDRNEHRALALRKLGESTSGIDDEPVSFALVDGEACVKRTTPCIPCFRRVGLNVRVAATEPRNRAPLEGRTEERAWLIGGDQRVELGGHEVMDEIDDPFLPETAAESAKEPWAVREGELVQARQVRAPRGIARCPEERDDGIPVLRCPHGPRLL